MEFFFIVRRSDQWLRRLIAASVTLFTMGQSSAWSASAAEIPSGRMERRRLFGRWQPQIQSLRRDHDLQQRNLRDAGHQIESYQWAVAFTNPAWNLNPGSKIELAYVVDGGQPRPPAGTALAANRVLIDFGGDAKGFQMISVVDDVLKIAAAQKGVYF